MRFWRKRHDRYTGASPGSPALSLFQTHVEHLAWELDYRWITLLMKLRTITIFQFFFIGDHHWSSNVGKTINHHVFDGLYHPFMMILGMVIIVLTWLNHIINDVGHFPHRSLRFPGGRPFSRGCTTEAGKLVAKRRAQVSWWQKLAMKWRSKESNDELTLW